MQRHCDMLTARPHVGNCTRPSTAHPPASHLTVNAAVGTWPAVKERTNQPTNRPTDYTIEHHESPPDEGTQYKQKSRLAHVIRGVYPHDQHTTQLTPPAQCRPIPYNVKPSHDNLSQVYGIIK